MRGTKFLRSFQFLFFPFCPRVRGTNEEKKPFKDGCILSGLFSSVPSEKQPLSRIFAFFSFPNLAFRKENRNLRSPGIRATSTDFVFQQALLKFFLSVKGGRKAKKFEIVKVCLSGQKKAWNAGQKRSSFPPSSFLWLGEYSTRCRGETFLAQFQRDSSPYFVFLSFFFCVKTSLPLPCISFVAGEALSVSQGGKRKKTKKDTWTDFR